MLALPPPTQSTIPRDVLLTVTTAGEPIARDEFIVSAETSQHMTSRADWLFNLSPLPAPVNVVSVHGGSPMPAVALGSIRLKRSDCPLDLFLEVHEVLLVPNVALNILSAAQLSGAGAPCLGADERGVMISTEDGVLVARGKKDRSIFVLDAVPQTMMTRWI